MDRLQRLIPALIWTALYAGIALYALDDYMEWGSNGFILGAATVPVVLRADAGQKRSLRYFYAALACCLLAWIIPAKTMLFATLVLALCFLADSFFGKINTLPMMAMMLMAPVFQYVTNIFTFPIRLHLTRLAGGILQLAGRDVTSEGNMLMLNGTEFSVDPACMGLSMMITALLCGIAAIGIAQRKTGKSLPIYLLLAWMAFILLLNTGSNLFRIVLLVQFHILPDNIMHDVMGIFCLGLYVLVPVFYLAPRLVNRFGKVPAERPVHPPHPRYMVLQAHLSLAACIFLLAYKTTLPREIIFATKAPTIEGYAVTPLKDEVTKLEHEGALVYIKKIKDCYYTDHHPTICWQGSGFAFKKVKEEKIGGISMFASTLEKGAERLYTAWWYDNGSLQTASQFEWRWNALTTRSRFALVNVTAASKEALIAEIGRISKGRAVQRTMGLE
ncbi:exosortase N [Chitinophaga deserti]|uniref:exosortase N n=1 Tax=Chitinophaga deserti TaxID=2164099 RepID=UPI000D6D2908|nr:exosortase N [Chitinophaga deserti]